ncbi:MAG: glycoside hydrolase family 3 protein [Lachnospiraceae bacterium]|nr:glycoside hydrolase family 3 protein [Lachnospiraceae bacterium]
MQIVSLLAITGVLLVNAAGCGREDSVTKDESRSEVKQIEERESRQETFSEGKATEPALSEEEIPTGRVEEFLSGMTLEEKIYQMFLVTPEQLTGVSPVTAAGDTTRSSLARYPVGGLVYFAQNLVSWEQTTAMLSEVQKFSYEIEGLPLFLCVDEEGGRVARVAGSGVFQVENVGPMAAVASKEEAYRCGDTIGAYLSELGFNVDFAPDADVLTNPGNSAIGDRSFGPDAEAVTNRAAAYSDGLHAHGILSTFKHFPGHGATEADTHAGYAYTGRTYEELMRAELKPFAAAQSLGVDFVMAAHISLPAVTGDDTPCSLSERMLTDILRGELGFQGLIVTDALNMGAISQNYASSTAAVMAVKAGADLLLMPEDLDAAFSGIYGAVMDGSITEERINESVRRILSVKLRS